MIAYIAISLLLLLSLRLWRANRRLAAHLLDARWQYVRERQRANVYKMHLDNDAAAKTVLLNQMRYMERRFAHMCIRRRRWAHFSAYRRVGAWQIVRGIQ